MIFKGKKKVFRSIHDGRLSLCKGQRARIERPARRIWPAGCSLPMSGPEISKNLRPKSWINYFMKITVPG